MTKNTKTIKKTKFIREFPSSGVDKLGIRDKTNSVTIKMTVAIILENVIFVGRFIISLLLIVSLRPYKPCFV